MTKFELINKEPIMYNTNPYIIWPSLDIYMYKYKCVGDIQTIAFVLPSKFNYYQRIINIVDLLVLHKCLRNRWSVRFQTPHHRWDKIQSQRWKLKNSSIIAYLLRCSKPPKVNNEVLLTCNLHDWNSTSKYITQHTQVVYWLHMFFIND